MKLGGFSLKKGKRKALGASAGFSASVPVATASPEKVFVTDFNPNAPAELSADGQKPLVIPLVETNAWQGPKEDQKKDQKKDQKDKIPNTPETADELAAAQILAETQIRDQKDAPQTLVIPIASEKAQKRAELFTDAEQRPKSDRKRPILQQNAVPGLDGMQDVTDKYRHDVALRPEAPDVHSDVYDSVPVEAFGAALLRGMGWTGDVDPEDVGAVPQPRHKLLGLGATKRPTLPGEDKKKRKKRKDKDTGGRSGLNADKPRGEDNERRSSRRSADRDRRRSRSESRSERRKRSRSRDRERDRGRDRRSRSHSRSGSGRHDRRR